MRAPHLLLVRPQRSTRVAVSVGALLLALAVSWLHLGAGFAYEFHLFFGLPVFAIAWYLGARAGFAMAAVVVVLWLLADLRLGGQQAEPLPLAFNSAIRLAIFAVAVALLAGLRRLLENESRLAREDALTGLANRREFLE